MASHLLLLKNNENLITNQRVSV